MQKKQKTKENKKEKKKTRFSLILVFKENMN